ncbi:transposase IS66 family protein [Acidithrix ferrooxidans]|uniref:Transposase IS66 family protein n=1 Tax=Acidithrix ferrooxidans TaxID=1280514 RepID=A0A0D8HHC7_9ACTN|nr:transposase IS66 family protein [Acidithrix ferrooxidans]
MIHDVPDNERICSGCGAPYAAFGEETPYQIDWQVHIVRHRHRRPTYRRTCKCQTRGMLVAPVPAKPIPKGMFTSGFLGRLVVEKYVIGRPLERIVAALSNDGFEVSKGTLTGALKALSDLLEQLDAAIRERNAKSAHLHIDETSWKVFEAVADKAGNRWWLWTFLGPDTVVFLIDPKCSTRVVAEHLGIDIDAGSLEPGRQLLISSDFYSVYQPLGALEGVDPLWCWAHIRCYFIRASDAHQELRSWTTSWLARIGSLYVAHHARQALETGTTGRLRAEEDFTRIIRAMDTARKAEACDPTLHPGAIKVLATLDREWEGLCRHEEFPELPLDNNPAEAVLRNPAVIRKNCYGSGSIWAATLAARIWTITATAQRAGCNPLAYLIAYLQECAAAGGRAPNPAALERFFPWVASETDLVEWRMSPPGPMP